MITYKYKISTMGSILGWGSFNIQSFGIQSFAVQLFDVESLERSVVQFLVVRYSVGESQRWLERRVYAEMVEKRVLA
jgi:hypothetical protein